MKWIEKELEEGKEWKMKVPEGNQGGGNWRRGRDVGEAGVDPEIEEGGGIHIDWGWCSVRSVQLSVEVWHTAF